MKAADISDREILELIEAHDFNPIEAFAYERLIARGIPDKVVYAKYDKIDRRGWIDYGVSLRTGWLTDKGRAELDRLRSA